MKNNEITQTTQTHNKQKITKAEHISNKKTTKIK